MVYSPGIVLIRDDNGEWRSPVEVDVLTSAAVNAGEIRRKLEREQRLRIERVEMEYWKKVGEERRKEDEKAMAGMQSLREETKNKKEKEKIAKSKEQASLVKEMVKKKEMDKGKAKDYLMYALENAEIKIQQTMYARISRILHLFQLHQTPYLILGSFGTGVFENRIDLIATIFADLLIKPGGRFKDIFQTVVFAILGKETARVFTEVFSRVDKRAQRERTGKTCVFKDSFGSGSDGDVKEGDEEKTMRMMKWKARRRRRNLPDAAADAASFDPVDVAFHPLSFDAAQASAVSYPTSSAAASSNAAQASVAFYPTSFDATQASAIPYPTFFTASRADAAVQANPAAADYYGVPEDAKIIRTRCDAQVDFVAEATVNGPITPNAMVIDDGRDIETVETKSLPTHSREAQNSRSNKKEEGDIESLRDIAQGTIKAINDGYVDFLDSNMRLTRHNIRKSAEDTVRGTEYFTGKPDSPWLKWWQSPPLDDAAERHANQSGVAVQILKMSTLQGAHFLSQTRPASESKIGILNFASATKPGGEFMNGSSAQEESIARSSTLYLSLQSHQATPFYKLHDRDNGGGYYSHAMIYSPSVAIFRNDNGDWLCPYHVDIITSLAVNAGLVRKLRYGSRPDTEGRILFVMRVRMGRILALFERLGIRNLVLGSFGTGVFENDVGSLAKIWGELLGAPGARFADSFDQVIFAIPDSCTQQNFEMDFNAAANPRM